MTKIELKDMTETNYMITKQISEGEMNAPVLLWNRIEEVERKREKLIKMFKEVDEIIAERNRLIAESYEENEDEIEDMYWDFIDVYGNAMTELEKYDEDFYKFCDKVFDIESDKNDGGNEIALKVAKNAIYCLTYCKIPEEVQ